MVGLVAVTNAAAPPSAPSKTSYTFYLDKDGPWPGAEQYFQNLECVTRLSVLWWNQSLNQDPWDPAEVPQPILEDTLKLPKLEHLRVSTGQWTRQSLETLAKNPSLKSLDLGYSRICEDDLGMLAQLQQLEELKFKTDFHPRLFITLAKLPKLRRIEVTGYGDHFPHQIIDAEIKKSIAMLDGRLEDFSGDGFDETDLGIMFGPAVTRELFKISSLKILKLDWISFELTLEDAKAIQALDHLQQLEIGHAPRRRNDPIQEILRSATEAARERRKSSNSLPHKVTSDR